MTHQSDHAELEVRRVVPAPPERVFDAWTSPDSLRAWWGPPGGSCSRAEVDLRVGGHYLLVNLMADSSTVSIRGEFLDVVRPDRLSYTWAIDTGSALVEHVTVQFKEHHDGTEVVVSHQRIASGSFEGHEAGWVSCLNGLVTYMTG